MTDDAREAAAREFETAADELERAVRHLRTTADHLRQQEMPRAFAHAFAASGHMRRAQDIVDARAVEHAARSNP